MSTRPIIVSVGLLLSSGCGMPEQRITPPQRQPGPTITLGESASGNKVDVEKGQKVLVRLSVNITTGYTWTLAEAADEAVLKNHGVVYAPTATGAVGSAGAQSWTFAAVGAGQQELRFIYSRPWERDTPPAKTVSFTIAVR